jgi:hypothetical protein
MGKASPTKESTESEGDVKSDNDRPISIESSAESKSNILSNVEKLLNNIPLPPGPPAHRESKASSAKEAAGNKKPKSDGILSRCGRYNLNSNES